MVRSEKYLPSLLKRQRVGNGTELLPLSGDRRVVGRREEALPCPAKDDPLRQPKWISASEQHFGWIHGAGRGASRSAGRSQSYGQNDP